MLACQPSTFTQRSMHHQKSSSDSPFQANTATPRRGEASLASVALGRALFCLANSGKPQTGGPRGHAEIKLQPTTGSALFIPPEKIFGPNCPSNRPSGPTLQKEEGWEGLCWTHQLLPRQLPLRSGWSRCYRQTSGTGLPAHTASRSAPTRQGDEQWRWAPGTASCDGQRGTHQR